MDGKLDYPHLNLARCCLSLSLMAHFGSRLSSIASSRIRVVIWNQQGLSLRRLLEVRGMQHLPLNLCLPYSTGNICIFTTLMLVSSKSSSEYSLQISLLTLSKQLSPLSINQTLLLPKSSNLSDRFLILTSQNIFNCARVDLKDLSYTLPT
jgi:hypothetical protein